jgi:hypothetical protein
VDCIGVVDSGGYILLLLYAGVFLAQYLAGYGVSDFGCETVKGIVRWLEIFLELATLGTAFLYLGTLGNHTYVYEQNNGLPQSLLGVVVVMFCTILAFQYSLDTPFFTTEKEDDKGSFYFSPLILGCILIIVQLGQLVRLFLPFERYPGMRSYFASGALKMERWTKMTVSHKIHRMINKALACHVGADIGDSAEILQGKVSLMLSTRTQHGPSSEVLLNFQQHQHKTEHVGGIIWTWRQLLFAKTLFFEEGIWLVPRLVASNLAQWIGTWAFPLGTYWHAQ